MAVDVAMAAVITASISQTLSPNHCAPLNPPFVGASSD
jgi:hypothetical protein